MLAAPLDWSVLTWVGSRETVTIREAADKAMRDTGMNDWVGGGHPALLGSVSGDVLERLSTIGLDRAWSISA